jgi:hypothetical protein
MFIPFMDNEQKIELPEKKINWYVSETQSDSDSENENSIDFYGVYSSQMRLIQSVEDDESPKRVRKSKSPKKKAHS